MKRILLFVFISLSAMNIAAQKQFSLTSPDNKIRANIEISNVGITYSVSHNGDLMLDKSPISMKLSDGKSFGVKPFLLGSSTRSVNEIIKATIYKKAEIKDNYNELTLKFKNDYSIIFRAYDDGIAYRFISTSKKPFKVISEKAKFNFPNDGKAFIPYVKARQSWKATVLDSLKSVIPTAFKNVFFEQQFHSSFENLYENINLSQWDKARLAFAPIVVEGSNGKKVCITESDLLNYPGMYLYNADGKTSLEGVFAPYLKQIAQCGNYILPFDVRSPEPYIAEFDGPTTFPWRAIIISENDKELANNDMVYKLATPAQFTDTSWIKPGKVAWEWWNDWNLYGVDFKTGINNETYKYYIDFASKHGIEYIILDEGWSVLKKEDLMQVVPEIDLKELIAYANTKNVGIILWSGYYALNKDIEGICKHYSEMGIKGFKVDFMDRDDQTMVDFHRRTSQIAAKYKMLIDFHGTYKPTGLQRTYPNVINFEGVHGLENMKWSDPDIDQVTYDVTIPFVRMVAGPLDYTQGAMRNASKGNYRPVNSEPMSQGTRCRQLAEYVIFESPLNMLCDSPSNYMKEKECTDFISSIPTVWDETVALDGEIAKYIAIARRSGSTWYLGAMTNWDDRTLNLNLEFLGTGNYKAEIFCDGANAHRVGRDYKKETIDIPASKNIKINMAPGGGFIMKITQK